MAQGEQPESQDAPQVAVTSVPPSAEPPLRSYSGDIYKRLRDLNASLPKRGRLDRIAVLLEMASLSWRLEALITTRDLLAQIDLVQSELSAAQRQTHLALTVNVSLAFGEHDRARAALLANLDLALRDDALAVAASELIDAGAEDGATRLARATLPSGAPNAYYLAARAHADPLLLARLSSSRPGPAAEGDTLLLFANAVRHVSDAAWTSYWARYLAGFDLPRPVAAGSSSGGNVLAGLRFPAPAPVHGERHVSILMSAHNAQDTIGYAIRSILGQSYRNLELLICDDASTDGTLDVIGRIADPRIRLYRSERNQGTYNVRNALIAKARGELIGFQDADDLSLPTRLADQVNEIARQGAVAATGSWVRLRADGEAIFFRDGRSRRFCAVSLLAEREIFARFGPYRSVQVGADTEFIEILRAGLEEERIAHLDRPLVLGLWSNQSMTRTPGTEALSDGYRAPARRAYAEIAARQRLLGKAIVPDSDVEACLGQHKIWRAPAPILRLR